MNGEGLVRVGLITKPRGLAGELWVQPLTDDPGRFRHLGEVFIEGPDAPKRGAGAAVSRGRIESAAVHRGRAIVKIEGCDDADAARAYRGCYISVTQDQLVKLPKDSYFIFDLVGCAVYGVDGQEAGTVTDVLSTGSNDVYVVSPGSGRRDGQKPADILVPALKSVVKEVDIPNKRIVIDYGSIEDTHAAR